MNKNIIICFICTILCGLFCEKSLAQSGELYLYGGYNQNVYLGCITCGSKNAESIWNTVGIYGSKTGAHSVWNQYGTYGSDYSNESAFNEYATNPPVVKDKVGNFYGYFTLDRFKQGRIETHLFNQIYEHYEEIRKDATAWYEQLEF